MGWVGELLRSQVGSVDFERNVLHIKRSIVKHRIGPPNRGSYFRTVYRWKIYYFLRVSAIPINAWFARNSTLLTLPVPVTRPTRVMVEPTLKVELGAGLTISTFSGCATRGA